MRMKVISILSMLIVTWLAWLLYVSENGVGSLTAHELTQSERLVREVAGAVLSYRASNGGELPSSCRQLLPAISGVDALIPGTARSRMHLSHIVFWKTPELMDVFGLWTVLGERDSSEFRIVLNPEFFGPRNVVVARISDKVEVTTLSVWEIAGWIDKE